MQQLSDALKIPVGANASLTGFLNAIGVHNPEQVGPETDAAYAALRNAFEVYQGIRSLPGSDVNETLLRTVPGINSMREQVASRIEAAMGRHRWASKDVVLPIVGIAIDQCAFALHAQLVPLLFPEIAQSEYQLWEAYAMSDDDGTQMPAGVIEAYQSMPLRPQSLEAAFSSYESTPADPNACKMFVLEMLERVRKGS